ncbi:MAG: hypothetical protein RIQ63_948 [Actinomycetota bacterium]|jgi:hypothetical protein|nr:hypothetical protein [Actinomycetota bacterium]NBT36694.1 hypothetical protein [Actinomycetota bacterium]NCZ93287.1 hypothetical protein [Actinomycetota bacterium]NDD87003.1 hypothetical protein [Actinomycetota bacterium]NDI18471.1 hypothetical protein [Actinomycetota bacterium]
MDGVTIAFSVLAALASFVIAAVVIGREARRLDSVAPRAVYDLDQAIEFVADRLPAETQARLTFDELRVLLKLHMRWIHDKGLQPADVIDRPQDITDVIVLGEETLTAYLLGKAEESRIEVLDDVDVVHVVRAHLAYFEMIGAVGPSASSNDL